MASRDGSVFKRCGCRQEATGKSLGTKCPKLRREDGAWNSRHGEWAFQLELPRTGEGKRRQARRGGLGSQEQAQAQLDHLKALIRLAEDEADVEVQVADLIQQALRARRSLPEAGEVKRRIGAGVRTREKVPTVAQWLKEWLDGKPDLAVKTRASYEGHIRNHLVPHLGATRLDKLTSWQVEEMFAAIEENNQRILECRESDEPKVRASVRGRRVISLSTKHRIRATLRSALSEAVRRAG
ncbi:tyrosine-type recombinase/integrase, partial [Nocardiopsis lucentensis]